MKYSLIETLMGFSVILVAILFLFFGLSLEKNINSKNISISAIFENVNGLSVGDKVKISGTLFIDSSSSNFEVQNLTKKGKIKSPEFTFAFDTIEKLN